MQILTITGNLDALSLTTKEKQILHILKERPYSLDELAKETDTISWNLLGLGRLEEHFIVQRCGFTPTDLLHVTGQFKRWDSSASVHMCELLSKASDCDVNRLIAYLLEEMVHRLSVEILKKQIDEETDPDLLDDCAVCQTLIRNLLNSANKEYRVSVKLFRPVIGIGAPVHFFLPKAVEIFNAKTIVPEHADVANAIGAITSKVMVRRRIRIKADEGRRYIVEGIEKSKRFETLEQASDWAIGELSRRILEMGQNSGTSSKKVEMDIKDSISNATNGTPLFLGRAIVARLSGRLDLVTEGVKKNRKQ